MTEVDGWTRHYGGFSFGVEPDDDRPLLLVGGNCQAEALRVVLSTAPTWASRPYASPRSTSWTAGDVRAAQLAWYAERPAVVTAGPQRYDDLIAPLGLDVG